MGDNKVRRTIPPGEVAEHALRPELSAPMGESVVFLEFLDGAFQVKFDVAQARRMAYLFEQAAYRAEGTLVEQDDGGYTYEATEAA